MSALFGVASKVYKFSLNTPEELLVPMALLECKELSIDTGTFGRSTEPEEELMLTKRLHELCAEDGKAGRAIRSPLTRSPPGVETRVW